MKQMLSKKVLKDSKSASSFAKSLAQAMKKKLKMKRGSAQADTIENLHEQNLIVEETERELEVRSQMTNNIPHQDLPAEPCKENINSRKEDKNGSWEGMSLSEINGKLNSRDNDGNIEALRTNDPYVGRNNLSSEFFPKSEGSKNVDCIYHQSNPKEQNLRTNLNRDGIKQGINQSTFLGKRKESHTSPMNNYQDDGEVKYFQQETPAPNCIYKIQEQTLIQKKQSVLGSYMNSSSSDSTQLKKTRGPRESKIELLLAWLDFIKFFRSWADDQSRSMSENRIILVSALEQDRQRAPKPKLQPPKIRLRL
jgi:hypothetical protein